MAIDPRQLRPGELARLLNSTPLGEVISERQLHRHRTRAGFRVAADGDRGGAGKVDLFRYVAWLVTTRHEALAEAAREPEGLTGYEAMKERARQRNAMLSLSGRDIGDLPDVADPARRARAAKDYKYFCEAYFPQTFHLKWSDDHLKVIAKIERAVLDGGLFAVAMPRGSGKTTLAEVACIWAILYGYHKFTVVVASAAKRAQELLESIQVELETNEMLLADFPEAVYPIRCLERIYNRANGQLYRGKPTRIAWTNNTIVMPTIDGSPASGAVIRVEGIEGSIRGMKQKMPGGQTVRPSLVVVDDPQTDESAGSLQQNVSRMRVLNGAILNLAGPGRKISGIMPCTVIRPNDMIDQILDPQKYPAWQGERMRAIYSWPTNENLWQQYGDLWRSGLADGGDKGAAARKFYIDHREKMDENVHVAWPARMYDDDVSAIQHLMNHRFTIGDEAFFAEYQNQPQKDEHVTAAMLSVDAIASKTNSIRRYEAPLGSEHIVAMIDVHDDLLFYCVAAWDSDYTGAVIDYGTYPDQGIVRFTKATAKRTMQTAAPGLGRVGAIRAGLDALSSAILGREYIREDGVVMRVGRCLVDAGHEPDAIYDFCRSSPHAAILMPSLGAGIGARNKPMTEYARKRGDQMGWHWYIPAPIRGRVGRYVRFDTNHWKQFVHDRLSTSVGDAGSVALWGRDQSRHIMFAEHLTAESPTAVTANGRTVGEWSMKPGRSDNHWLDCVVGCAVAASMLGASLPGSRATIDVRRKKYKR